MNPESERIPYRQLDLTWVVGRADQPELRIHMDAVKRILADGVVVVCAIEQIEKLGAEDQILILSVDPGRFLDGKILTHEGGWTCAWSRRWPRRGAPPSS